MDVRLTDEQQLLLDRITIQCPAVIALRQIALGFRSALTSGESIQMRRWIEGAKRCELGSKRALPSCHRELG